MGALVKAFEAKYGIKVDVWRASSEKVLQRAIQEAQAGAPAWTSPRPTAPSSRR
jgi:ABC-type Fe3+ transport system substrate-binding protein